MKSDVRIRRAAQLEGQFEGLLQGPATHRKRQDKLCTAFQRFPRPGLSDSVGLVLIGPLVAFFLHDVAPNFVALDLGCRLGSVLTCARPDTTCGWTRPEYPKREGEYQTWLNAERIVSSAQIRKFLNRRYSAFQALQARALDLPLSALPC